MAARGSVAKQKVIDKIQEAFGNDFVTKEGSKVYVWADDGGERVQIAINLTCPKNIIRESVNPISPEPSVLSPEETATIETLMEKLNL